LDTPQPQILPMHSESPYGGPVADYWRRHGYLLGTLALVPALIAIYYFAYLVRFEGQLDACARYCFAATAAWVVTTKLAWFTACRLCQGWRRSVTFYDLIVLLKTTTAALASLVVIAHFVVSAPAIPRSVLLIDWGTTIVLFGGARALLRGVRETGWPLLGGGERIGVLVVGFSDMGESAVRAIRRLGPAYRVVGFIDADPLLVGTRVEGAPVLGTFAQTRQIAEQHDVKQVLVVQGRLSGPQWRALMDDARQGSFELRVLPSFQQLISGSVTIQPRAVSIEDLLQREPVELDISQIRQWIEHRVILVTGSAGSIGSEICRQVLQFSPKRLVLLDRAENGQFFLDRELRQFGSRAKLDVCLADVLNEPRMRRILATHRPDVIFHAAAYKHVPLMETHPDEAVRNIILATRRLADLAMQYDTQSFVMISTDKAVNPSSVMGTCKRVAELYVQSLTDRSACRFVTVRFGNVLDSAGSVVQLFRQQIAAGGPVTVTDPNMQRYFMTIPEAARLVVQAGAIGQSGQILVLDMGEPVRIVDLAADMIRLSGLRVGEDIDIEFTGLRPGEKLYEELHIPGEQRLPTCHPKIILADHKPAEHARIVEVIDELERLAVQNPEVIVAQLAAIVPEYSRKAAISPIKLRAAA
jgi:FlaA1/EpsC-like NDP-sugar epimerase